MEIETKLIFSCLRRSRTLFQIHYCFTFFAIVNSVNSIEINKPLILNRKQYTLMFLKPFNFNGLIS